MRSVRMSVHLATVQIGSGQAVLAESVKVAVINAHSEFQINVPQGFSGSRSAPQSFKDRVWGLPVA